MSRWLASRWTRRDRSPERSSELQRLNQSVGDAALRRSGGRLPVGAAYGREETLFLVILFEHVERVPQEQRAVAQVAARLQHLQHEGRIGQGNGAKCRRRGRALGTPGRRAKIDEGAGRTPPSRGREHAQAAS